MEFEQKISSSISLGSNLVILVINNLNFDFYKSLQTYNRRLSVKISGHITKIAPFHRPVLAVALSYEENSSKQDKIPSIRKRWIA
jgi:hypothetical protein